jgi:hypothetical protein
MIIKFSCAVPDIDQLVLMLSIPQMWNLERNISGFEAERYLIIISCGLRDIEKKRVGLQVVYTLQGARIHLFSQHCGLLDSHQGSQHCGLLDSHQGSQHCGLLDSHQGSQHCGLLDFH